MQQKKQFSVFQSLTKYLPEGTLPTIVSYLEKYQVELTIKRSRKTLLGDYRSPGRGKGHRISINGDLNRYDFFLTLVHELAHLLVFVRHGAKVKPHGVIWKRTFQELMQEIDAIGSFPQEIAGALHNYMKNPVARSHSDTALAKAFRKYDAPRPKEVLMVEDLSDGERFSVNGGALFVREKKMRKRYQCRSLENGNLYSFHPLYEVKRLK